MQLDEVNKKLKRTQAALETERKAKTRIVQKAK